MMARKQAQAVRAKSDEGYSAGESEAVSAPRWLPVAVVGVAMVSFVGLAWYAYHAGSRSMKEEDLVLIEADKTPVKEKPEDPGGMKFPHQDKTIFDAISANPNAGQQGEHVMPAPEEPLNREQVQAAGDASTWVNDKLKADGLAPAAPATDPAAPPTPELAAPVQPVMPGAPNAQIAAALPVDTPPPPPVETLPLAAPAAAPAPAAEAPKVDVPAAPAPVELKPTVKEGQKSTEPVKKAAPKAEKPAATTVAKAKPAAAGRGSVQLGAYKSEAEAKSAWNAASKKHKELAGLSPAIVKADLGAKGVFYRLRVSVADPKELCAGLAAKNQACMPVK